MTLQNKNNHFLGKQDDHVDNDDVVDIFDQYGAGDDVGTAVTPQTQDLSDEQVGTVATEDLVQEKDPVAFVDESMTEENGNDASVAPHVPLDEKKWEADYEGGKEKIVAQPIVSEPVVETAPLPDVPKKQEKVIESEEKKDDAPKAEEPIAVVPEGEVPSTPEPPVHVSEKQTEPVAAPLKENMNSVVQAENREDIKKSFVQSQKQVTSRRVKIDPSKKTIAIVDDDVDTLDMYANIFEMADYNVICASDGLEALGMISEHTPHVIFTGIVMPRMDGFAMIEALKQNKRTADIPVVINSHLGRETDRKRAEELGARDFIIRGFTPPREAVERIGALLLRSEYIFRFDIHDTEARKLVKDLGASNFFVCPRGQEMVLKLSITDPKELLFSARFSCVDQKTDKK
ncbi:MAG: response regulator [Parcubacteria group bacterium]|jgi:DNA-binding response OmpR family regulator